MKRIELYVDGKHLVIEECEGRPEIRHYEQSRAMAHTKTTVTVGSAFGGVCGVIEVKVEAGE